MNKTTDRADTLQPGDWTFYDGYRPIAKIRKYPRLRQVRVTLSDGSSRKFLSSTPIQRVDANQR